MRMIEIRDFDVPGEASHLFALESKFGVDPVRDFAEPLDPLLIAAPSRF